jgi:hypothetical protein
MRMRWLRSVSVQVGKLTFTDVVNRVLPVLAEGSASASGQHAADLLAHMGWADFLRIREGATGLDPETYYRKALAQEPSNVFAHAMWGHRIMVKRGPIARPGSILLPHSRADASVHSSGPSSSRRCCTSRTSRANRSRAHCQRHAQERRSHRSCFA